MNEDIEAPPHGHDTSETPAPHDGTSAEGGALDADADSEIPTER